MSATLMIAIEQVLTKSTRSLSLRKVWNYYSGWQRDARYSADSSTSFKSSVQKPNRRQKRLQHYSMSHAATSSQIQHRSLSSKRRCSHPSKPLPQSIKDSSTRVSRICQQSVNISSRAHVMCDCTGHHGAHSPSLARWHVVSYIVRLKLTALADRAIQHAKGKLKTASLEADIDAATDTHSLYLVT